MVKVNLQISFEHAGKLEEPSLLSRPKVGNGRNCCKSGPRYLSRAVWEARPGVAGEQKLLREQELAGIS